MNDPCTTNADCNATFFPDTSYECVGAGNPKSNFFGNLAKRCRLEIADREPVRTATGGD